MNNIKVAVCGDPHSGKSVFLGALTILLPRESFYLFRACPDGEGTWTWKNADSAKYRVKGSFNENLIAWYCKAIENSHNLAPITLVDLGGKRSTENEQLVRSCSHCIILSHSLEGIKAWEEFALKLDTPVIAKVLSDYAGKEDTMVDGIFTCHHLDRDDKTVCERTTIKQLAMELLNMISGDNSMNNDVLEVTKLAEELGKEAIEKTLPNGRVIKTIEWSGKDLPAIAKVLHNMPKSEHIKINGGMPGFLAVALTHECHPSSVSINSPDGYIGIGCQAPEGDGASDVLNFKKTEIADSVVRIDISQKDAGVPLAPSCLDTLTPPTVDIQDIVILSGRMPLWVMASIAMAYHGKCKAIALFQPGVGATVAISHSPDVPLGFVIDIK